MANNVSERLTSVDIRILEQIQKDSSLSTTELADRVGLSQSPCWRRLQRLKEEGYVKGQVALIDRSKLGSFLTIFATLKMATLTEEKRAEFVRKVENTPEVMECFTLFGEMDIMMKIVAPSLDWYQRFIFNVILKLPGVLDVQSTVALNEIKNTTALPLRDLL
jgi:Lrp/AsnC family transcriptional regulator